MIFLRPSFSYLLKEDKDKIVQPNLIIGEDGSGKTSLLKRMYFSIENSGKQLKPVFIEGKELSRPMIYGSFVHCRMIPVGVFC